jgi:hypothetical protein
MEKPREELRLFSQFCLKRCVFSKSPPSVFHFISWLLWLTKHFNQPGATDHMGVLTQSGGTLQIERKNMTEGSKATRDETIPFLHSLALH